MTTDSTQLSDLAAALARVEQLEQALESRVAVEQAKGILRERFGWTLDEAFDVLRYAARSSRRKIHEVALEVVAADRTPTAVAVELARSARWRATHMLEHAERQRENARQLEAEVRRQQERLEWGLVERPGRRSAHH